MSMCIEMDLVVLLQWWAVKRVRDARPIKWVPDSATTLSLLSSDKNDVMCNTYIKAPKKVLQKVSSAVSAWLVIPIGPLAGSP